MKTLLTLLSSLLIAVSLPAATQIYTTVTVTNAAAVTNGMQLTVNGDVRFAVTNITNAAKNFAITNSDTRLATNLYTHVLAYGFTNVTLQYAGSNAIRLSGGTNVALAVSQFGGWASISNYTSVVFSAAPVALPYGSQHSTDFRQWQQSLVIDALNTYPTNKLIATASVLADLRAWITNRFLHRGANDLDVVGEFELNSYDIDSSDAVYWHFDAWGGGSDGRAGAYSSDPRGGFNGTNNPGMVATLGNSESLANKTLISPVINGTVTGDFTFSGNINFTGSPTFSGSTLSNSVFTGRPRWTIKSYAGAASPLFEILTPAGGGSSDNDYGMVFTNNDGRTWTFGRWKDADQVWSYPTNTIATEGAVGTIIQTNWRGQPSGLAELDSNSKLPTNRFPAGAPLVSPLIFGTSTNDGTILSSIDVYTLGAGANLLVRGTRQVAIFGPTAGAAFLDAITNKLNTNDHFTAWNNTGYPLTVRNESSVTTAGATEQIRLVNNVSNIVVQSGGKLEFAYDYQISRWRLLYPEQLPTTVTNVTLGLTTQTNRLIGYTNFNLASVSAQGELQFAISLPGTKTNDFPEVHAPFNAISNAVSFHAEVLSNDWVNVRVINASTNAVDLPAATYRVKVEQFQ